MSLLTWLFDFLHLSPKQDAELLLHEADALFGKRSEVRDSHDHYNSMETGDIDPPPPKP